ncbi:hypothetical protein FOMPIDRAFT_1163230 [Fomitopsis schrenkii]|uniref:Uncharacterized protein n=1 Tax=Fomitopsis schrenkii TaxID=2126942 RepID=S8E5C7_FOMSC|nr:hypothetical protein FOMPIDRAFT_1163230 [Fomitopsis schrenkii]
MLVLSAALLGAACLAAHAASSRPYELLIYRKGKTCNLATLKKAQEYRGNVAYGHPGRTDLGGGEDRLRVVFEAREHAWVHLEMACGPRDSWEFPVLTDTAPLPLTGSQVRTELGASAEQDVLALPEPARGLFPLEFELEPLVKSGHSSNRVDLIFFADGYTRNERDKFIEDANRLAADISGNQTFYTVKPLLNFWAAFTPSAESGVGTHGKPNDTPFGLYRDGTELRGVYYARPEMARAACFYFEDKCDYPILMGNDPLYGGLGGEFTVITPSLANGALVLRHELGHSIIDVGEEYDGGPDYFGVNAHHNLSEPIPWAHWYTNASRVQSGDDDAKVRVERSVMPMQAYPWTMLNASAPWATIFISSGAYARHLVRFSLSGLPNAADLRVEIDGEDLGWTPRADIGLDRWHYDVHRDGALGAGEHEVKFTLANGEREGTAQLCSVEVLEFGTEDEFVSAPNYYGVFPTFSDVNVTSYRPTNEDCLMRIVTTPNFCKVCLEDLWLKLLRRVDLIDSLRTSCVRKGREWVRHLELDLVPLGQFREEPVDVKESYSIIWTKDGRVLEEFTNERVLEIPDAGAAGVYTAHVEYLTEEVRVDKEGLLKSNREHRILATCEVLE